MMTLKRMSATEVTKISYACEFCNSKFTRERTLLSHMCKTKHRWIDKDKHGNRVGYQSFLQFYAKHTINKKQKSYEDFIKSPYYTAFTKFGNYCVDIKCINIARYTDWLLSNSIKIDNWAEDKNYTTFLYSYLRSEDAFDAVCRSIEHCMTAAEVENVNSNDYLRYGNSNKICYAITTGKISPWILYHSISGKEFLDKLDQGQLQLIYDYINPELWNIKFKRDTELVLQIKDLLKNAKY